MSTKNENRKWIQPHYKPNNPQFSSFQFQSVIWKVVVKSLKKILKDVGNGIKMNNARDTNYFTKRFKNCWYDEWLLIKKWY